MRKAFTGRVPITRDRKISTPMDTGLRCQTTDLSGCRRCRWVGCRTVTDAGFGSRTTVGPGFRMSRGAGLRITTDAGSIRAHRGYGGQGRWAAMDGGMDTEGDSTGPSGLPHTFPFSALAAA